MLDADDFVVLSELGLTVDQITAHARATRADAELLSQDNWQCSASEANARLRAAGPISLLAQAARGARHNDKLMLYLLDKLWHPTQPSTEPAQNVDIGQLSNAQLTKIWQIMRGGDGV